MQPFGWVLRRSVHVSHLASVSDILRTFTAPILLACEAVILFRNRSAAIISSWLIGTQMIRHLPWPSKCGKSKTCPLNFSDELRHQFSPTNPLGAAITRSVPSASRRGHKCRVTSSWNQKTVPNALNFLARVRLPCLPAFLLSTRHSSPCCNK
jgi:hypothetical protein